MKKREIFSQLTVPSAAIVRIDGRRFGRVLYQLQFDKPYDISFTKGMVDSATDFFNKSGINPSTLPT
jgi:tRNA(His) 5'-end guanylyltransferase